MIRQRLVSALDPWLDDCCNSGVTRFQRFARSLQQDHAAVRAALETPCSRGQTDAQVNRLKLIKRQMYGRAILDLLRLRVLHAP